MGKRKDLLYLGLVVAVAVVTALLVSLTAKNVEAPERGVAVTPKEPAGEQWRATGNVDKTSEAFSFEAGEEETVFTGEEDEMREVTSDSQAIGDVGQSFNESDL
jgi:hypothetical protein